MLVHSLARIAPLVGAALALTACAEPVTRVAIGPDSENIDARTIVGKPVPDWDLDWMGASPIQPADLRGKVLLVRWFTDDCPHCASTAPSLVTFHRDLERNGLRVIGMYHHKSDGPLKAANVRAFAERLGFQFPVAIDPDWRTLKKWWLDDHPGWTSVSFLIDRKGVVRFVHTGGEYRPGSEDAERMRRWINQLLTET